MSAETRVPDTADEEFLDHVFERAVAWIEDGLDPAVEDLLEGREHLRAEMDALLGTARQVAVLRPRTMPRVAGFTILHEIGRGGMGTVYLARQEALGGRQVALKVLPSTAGLSTRARDRFHREARVIAQLRHPNVVTIHDVVSGDGVLAYAMEWVDGASLGDLIGFLTREGRGAERESDRKEPDLSQVAGLLGRTAVSAADSYPVFIARIGVAIGRALAALHRTGLVHRDVKPSNILVRRDGTPLLSDFGLVHATDGTITQSGLFAGTIAYASPEQLGGDPESLDARSDVFALGITLYHALTLHLPFDVVRGRALHRRTPSGMIRLIEGGRAAPLQSWNRRLPQDLETIVGKAMDPDPARRYETADEMADDLERMIALQPIRARPAGLVSRGAKFLRRNRVAALGIAAGSVISIAVALAVVAYVFLVPRWVEDHVRRARLSLINPSQANILIRREFWGMRPWDDEPLMGLENVAGLDGALGEYALASRWAPFSRDLREERDVVAEFRATLDRGGSRSNASSAARSPSRSAGLYAFLEGDVDAALANFSRWEAERNPREDPDPFVEAALGVLYLVREEPARAYPRLREACQAFPDIGFLTTYLADAALQCGDIDDAERLLAAASQMPRLDNKGALERVRANLFAARGRDSEAEALYRTADPETPCGLQYARFLASRGRTEEALDQHVRGHQRVPSRPGKREFAALLDRWWAGFSPGERTGRICATLDEDPFAPRSLVARLRAYVPQVTASNSPLGSALRTPESSPSLQDAPLAELRDVLEVENEVRWREIPRYPRFLKFLQFRAWHGPGSSHVSELIFRLSQMGTSLARRGV